MYNTQLSIKYRYGRYFRNISKKCTGTYTGYSRLIVWIIQVHPDEIDKLTSVSRVNFLNVDCHKQHFNISEIFTKTDLATFKEICFYVQWSP